jgi:hypothetical protein
VVGAEHDRGGDQDLQALGRIGPGRRQGSLARVEVSLDALIEYRLEQVLLARVVVVERRHAHPAALRDVADGSRPIALLHELLAGRVDDLLLAGRSHGGSSDGQPVEKIVAYRTIENLRRCQAADLGRLAKPQPCGRRLRATPRSSRCARS